MRVQSWPVSVLIVAASLTLQAQTPSPARLPERAVRRTIPMTNAIRHAFVAGTRDSSGRPGRNYGQLRTDYSIDARLDPTTSRITGHETIVVQNNTSDSLTSIVMRLDQNLFIFQSPHASPWVPAEPTDGFVVTRMPVNGQAVNLAVPAVGGRGGRGAAASAATEHRTSGMNSTRATIALVNAIPARGRATIEVDWSHTVPGGPGIAHRMVQRWADTLYQPSQWYPRVAVYRGQYVGAIAALRAKLAGA